MFKYTCTSFIKYKCKHIIHLLDRAVVVDVETRECSLQGTSMFWIVGGNQENQKKNPVPIWVAIVHFYWDCNRRPVSTGEWLSLPKTPPPPSIQNCIKGNFF